MMVDDGDRGGGDRRGGNVAMNDAPENIDLQETTLISIFSNDDAHFYPCPVPKCDYSSESRSERNYHLRVDHAKCSYQNVARDLVEESAWRSNPHEFTGSAPHVTNERIGNMSDYHVDSSDAFSDSGYDLDVEDEAYGVPQYKDDDIYSDVKFESDFRAATHMGRKRGRPRNPPGSEPAEHSKVRVSDPNGKYKCYMPDCDWKGAYRSLRCDHMRWCHKDWVMPPRYILQRITKDGIYIDPKTFVPPFSCPVEGCEWRGSYRASRSQHIKSAHPCYVPPKKKAPVGGYVADGKYLCHIPQCTWRGISRSTRASHMRKVHGGFANPVYSTRQVACCDCTATFGSHKAFVDHMISVHRVGGLVHRDFNNIGEYEEWFNSVQDVFSVVYVKRMGIKHGNDYQVLYLYCARSGGFRPKQVPGRDYFPEFTKRRLTRRPTKCGRNCAAFLRIIQWIDGRLTVIGCVEHTGHRMGTALLRLSTNERVVLDEYLYVVDDKVPLDAMLDRIREVEGFTMDGFEVRERNVEDMTRYVMNENEFISLKTSSFFEPDSTFAVNLFDAEGRELSEGVSFGIMTSQMRELWATYSARAACIEEVNLLISNFELHLFFVMVFDANDMPRCACVFISQCGDKVALFEKLRSVSSSLVDTIVTDCSPEWPPLLEAYFGNEAYSSDFQVSIQIAEWHLLSEWATRLDDMVSNRVDRFAIICALRRWTRATDPSLFEGIVVDMFEAFREMELNSLAQLVDSQLTDPEFAKRDSSQLLADGTLLSSSQHGVEVMQPSAEPGKQDQLLFNNKRMKTEAEDEVAFL
uniref:C2H2-type domain-containing protein n=1 Tax=Angiostrongylus cantonensis TaxID=6313 RepID=A0A0K0CZM8_ANGCA